MRSWRRTIFAVFALAIALIMIVVVWANVNSVVNVSRSQQDGNRQAAQAWSKLLSNQLGSVAEHRRDIAITLYNTNEWAYGSGPLSLAARHRLNEDMNDKMLVNQYISFLYLYDREEESMMLVGHAQTTGGDLLELRRFLKGRDINEEIPPDGRWRVIRTGENAYFTCSSALGKYTVGVLSKLAYYDPLESVYLMGDGAGCYLLWEDETICMGGGAEWEDPALWDGGKVKSAGLFGVNTVTADFPPMDAVIAVAARPFSWKSLMSTSAPLLFISSAVGLVAVLLLVRFLNGLVVRPLDEIRRANQEIRSGSLDYRISAEPNSQEFRELYQSFNDMADQINSLRIENYERRLEQRSNELTVLRSQLRPHFYLNALTTAYNMTYTGTPEDVRHYIQLLSRHMRYMLNVRGDTVPLSLELGHVRNYVMMQNMKLPDSIDVYIGCEDELAAFPVPYLLIFTVVENAFKHAMTLYNTLQLIIQCEWESGPDFTGLKVIVEDNGEGFPQAVLDAFRVGAEPPEPKDHIGLSNVSRTLQLMFERRDLLEISNSPAKGAHVEIRIPEGAPAVLPEPETGPIDQGGEEHEAADL